MSRSALPERSARVLYLAPDDLVALVPRVEEHPVPLARAAIDQVAVVQARVALLNVDGVVFEAAVYGICVLLGGVVKPGWCSYPRRYASRRRQRVLVEEDETTWDELETIVWLVEPDEVEEDWIEEEKPPLE